MYLGGLDRARLLLVFSVAETKVKCSKLGSEYTDRGNVLSLQVDCLKLGDVEGKTDLRNKA